MGNKTSNQYNKYSIMDLQIQQIEHELKILSQKLKKFEEEIDIKNEELHEKIAENKSLQIKITQNQKELIEKIKKYGFTFPDCFHWTLDIIFYIDNDISKHSYNGIFQYGNYQIIMEVPSNKIQINEIEHAQIDGIILKFFKRNCHDEIYRFNFPFTMLYDRAEILNLGLYNDPILRKDIIFFYNTDGIIQEISPNFSKFVNIIEKYIKWAVEYQEPNINNIMTNRFEDVIKNNTKDDIIKNNTRDDINKSISLKGPDSLTSIKNATSEQNNQKKSNSLIDLF